MPGLMDLLQALAGVEADPTGALRPTGGGLLAPVTLPPMLANQAYGQFANFANIPGAAQAPGDVFDRLGRMVHGALQVSEAAGTMAGLPIINRGAQIAQAMSNPIPGAAGVMGTVGAIP